jgi:hypothetical protein
MEDSFWQQNAARSRRAAVRSRRAPACARDRPGTARNAVSKPWPIGSGGSRISSARGRCFGRGTRGTVRTGIGGDVGRRRKDTRLHSRVLSRDEASSPRRGAPAAAARGVQGRAPLELERGVCASAADCQETSRDPHRQALARRSARPPGVHRRAPRRGPSSELESCDERNPVWGAYEKNPFQKIALFKRIGRRSVLIDRPYL